MPLATTKAINKMIQQLDPTAEFVKGEGYCYFVGDTVDRAYTTNVMVPRISDFTVDQWVKFFKEFQESAKGFGSIL